MALPLRIGALAGLTAPLLAFTFILAAIAFYPQFSWTNNALSDLGVVEGTTSALFTFGLCIAGVLAFVFSVLGLYSFAGKSRLGKLGSAVFAAATLALIFIGIFNEHFVPTHYLVSVAFFTLAPIGLFILTCAFYRNHQRGLAAFTFAISIIAALPWILQFSLHYVPNVAVPETVSALAVSVWAIVLATKMIRDKKFRFIGMRSIF